MAVRLDVKNWVTHVQSPRVERLLKAAAQSNAISFAGGLPAEELFPAEQIEAAFQRAMTDNAREALQYTWSEGCEPLRRQIAALMLTRGISVAPEQILITHGAQQALDLLGKALLQNGDAIALESPTYVPAIQAFELQQPKLCAVYRNADGLDFQALEQTLRNDRPRLVYIVPAGHNPTGAVLNAPQREQLRAVLGGQQTVLIEDDVYGALQYEGDEPAVSAGTDFSNSVYVGSFSKVLSPGLRVGWLAGSLELVKQLALVKQASDLQNSTLNQLALSEYLLTNSLADHGQRCRDFYRERRDAMLTALTEFFPAEARWHPPRAGFSIWIEMPATCSAEALLKAAMSRGVAFEPGEPFFPTGKRQNFLRLSFSNQAVERIDAGVRRLGDVLKEHLRGGNSTGRSSCGTS